MPVMLISILNHIWKNKALYTIGLLIVIIGICTLRINSLKTQRDKLNDKIKEQHQMIETNEKSIKDLNEQSKLQLKQCLEKEKVSAKDLDDCHKNLEENANIDRIKGKIKKEIETVDKECLPSETECTTTVYKCPDLSPMWSEYNNWTEKNNALFNIISE